MLHQVVNIFPLVGVLVLQKSLKILRCICLEGEQGFCLASLRYCFLTCPALSPHPLPSLISSCLNLPFGTQERSWRLKEACFLQTRNRRHRKTFVSRSPAGSCSVSSLRWRLEGMHSLLECFLWADTIPRAEIL